MTLRELGKRLREKPLTAATQHRASAKHVNSKLARSIAAITTSTERPIDAVSLPSCDAPLLP
jgi:hypothetical protein